MPNYPPLEAIGTALYSRLSGDTTLTTTLGATVVNDEAEDQAHPFVLLPGAGGQPWNTLGGYGWQCEVTPVVFSRYEGDLQAIQIAQRVIELLNFYALTVAGYQTVICEVDPDQSPLPIKVKTEYPQKQERRALAIRFQIKVHE